MFKFTHLCSLLALSLCCALPACAIEDGSSDEFDGEDAIVESENVEEASSALSALGGICDFDADCWSGYCVHGGRASGDTVLGRCMARSANGSYCSRNAGCLSGWCYQNVCTAAPHAPG